jgi:hypothetical protein
MDIQAERWREREKVGQTEGQRKRGQKVVEKQRRGERGVEGGAKEVAYLSLSLFLSLSLSVHIYVSLSLSFCLCIRLSCSLSPSPFSPFPFLPLPSL